MNGLDKVIEHLNHAHLDALLNPPTDDMILEHLKKEMGHIPADYIEFLKRCNGLTLYHSGDYCLFDAQEILSFHFSNDNLLCRSAWKIGYWMGYDIVINVDDIEKEYNRKRTNTINEIRRGFFPFFVGRSPRRIFAFENRFL